MAASIEIRYSRSEIVSGLQSYDLTATAVSSTDMPKEIFLYQHGAAPAPGSGEDPTDMFCCLADPVDLEEVPVGSANLAEEMPYYRTDTVTLRFRDMTTLEEVRLLIDADVRQLVDSLKVAENLPVMEDVDYV